MTIDQGAGQADPTTTSPIVFEVVFSEPVADFTTGDVSLGGTAGATTATVNGSGTSYTVSVTGMTQSGTVTASVAAGVAHDSTNNPNDASTSTDNTVTYIPTPPSDPLANLAAAIKNASPPLSAKLATDLLGRIHTIEKEVKQGKTGEACAELGKLANRIQKALTTKPPALTSAQAHDFLKLVSAAKKTIGC